VNVVTLIGNLATDVELKELPNDKKLATFRLDGIPQAPRSVSRVTHPFPFRRSLPIRTPAYPIDG